MRRTFVLGLALLISIVSLPALGQGLTSFVPDPDGVFIQRFDDNPDLGNVRVVVQLSKESIDQLADVTGHGDFLVVGAAGAETILRDDGKSPDDRAGDGAFAGVISIDEAELSERAQSDQTNTDSRGNVTVPDFSGRSKGGDKTATAFNFADFQAGKLVPFNRAVETSEASGDTFEDPSGLGRLVASHERIDVATEEAITPGTNAFQERVLMIRDLSVVQDPTRTLDPCTGAGTPMGVWTFGHLMREMANQGASGINPSDLVEQWLLQWGAAQNINSFNVPPRAAMTSLINDWRTASGGGDLDLSIAPFRLLAIVPRLDLRNTTGSSGGYGGTSTGDFLDAGEARFVFGVVLPPGYNAAPFVAPVNLGGGCRALRFSVIFEYGVPKCECEDVRDWARAWRSLASLPFPSAQYNNRLHRLTEQFVRAGANPLKPNGNALNQLRTNEVAMGVPWELREFRLLTFPFDFLHETTTVDTPNNDTAAGPSFQGTVTLSNFILAGPAPVPLFFSGQNFLGANPETPNPAFVWNGPLPLDAANIVAHSDLRHGFSLGTCNGCHGGEPAVPAFVHIDPVTPAGFPAILSGFLTGIAVNDPIYTGAGAPIVREFDDLERREIDIKALARTKCFRFRRINRLHVLSALQETRALPLNLFEELPPEPADEQPKFALDDLLANLPTQAH